MTFHSIRAKAAQGARTRHPVNGQKRSPRIMVTLDEADFRRLTWWAAKKGKPVAAVLRDAVWAYLVPIAADADAATKDLKR